MGEVELHHEWLGCASPERPVPVVFLNGVGMSAAMWYPIARPCAERRRCLLFDFRGQLLSDGPEDGPFDFATQLEDTRRLLDSLGIHAAHLVGTSYGSEVAMTLAFTYPERARSLTVIAGVSEVSPVLLRVADAWSAAASVSQRLLVKVMVPWNYSSGYLRREGAALDARLGELPDEPTPFSRAFAKLCGRWRGFDITSELERIRCPTLVIAGEHDILKPPSASEVVHRKIPGSEYRLIRDAGHAVVIEKPQEVFELVSAFLDRSEEAGGPEELGGPGHRT